jgi:hypothetical protein
MERRTSLRARGGWSFGWAFPFVIPVVGFVSLAAYTARAKRRRNNTAWARSQQAHSSGMRRLRGVAGASEPADALFRALVAFVADAIDLDSGGMTSADVERELSAAGVPRADRDRLVQILRACERARYGSQGLSRDEVMALIGASESCMDALDAFSRQRQRR